jgi:hypothetical protein
MTQCLDDWRSADYLPGNSMRPIFFIGLSVLRLRIAIPCRALTNKRRAAAAMGALAGIVVVCAMSGCAAQDIVVSEVAMTDRVDAAVVGWTATESGREVFSAEDEEITIKLLFNFNYRGVYEWFKVEWIAPGGAAYKVVSRRTDFASHRDFKASLKIRGKMASRLPGLWRVRVSLLGREGAANRELTSRLFRIAAPSAQMIAAGLTPVDVPDAVQQRPLAGYARVDPTSRDSLNAGKQQPPAANALADVAKPVAANGAQVVAKPPAARVANAENSQAAARSAQQPAVLAPLAIVGARAPAAPTAAVVAASKSRVQQLPAEVGISAVSLRVTPADPKKRQMPPRARNYLGCPPLYYRPGPRCIEQAAQE